MLAAGRGGDRAGMSAGVALPRRVTLLRDLEGASPRGRPGGHVRRGARAGCGESPDIDIDIDMIFTLILMLISTFTDVDVNVDVEVDIDVNIDIDTEGCNGGIQRGQLIRRPVGGDAMDAVDAGDQQY